MSEGRSEYSPTATEQQVATAVNDIFQCQEGVHTIEPKNLNDPAGTACRCGAIGLIGVMAAVKGDRRVFMKYMIDTNPDEEHDDD